LIKEQKTIKDQEVLSMIENEKQSILDLITEQIEKITKVLEEYQIE
jgi:hypothetical protein